jgi:hypothetical protein
MKALRPFLLVVLSITLAACASEPTAPDHKPGAPRSSGYTFGSGHVVVQVENTAATGPEGTVAADSASERGGYTYGSGH